MKNSPIFYFVLLVLFSKNAEAQLVLNDGVIVYVNGGTSNVSSANIVLNTPPATPISRQGVLTSQGIMLESEWDRVQYNLGNGTTSITVPYISNTTGSLVPFPLTVSGIAAGTNQVGKTGAIRFSSKKSALAIGAGWDNSLYMPSQVTNVCNTLIAACPGSNNSANVIDRFWVIDPVYYQPNLNPAVTLDFTYIMEESNLNGSNTASLNTLFQPQRFDTLNTGAAIWGWNGFPSIPAEMGTNTPGVMNATGVGTMTGVQVSHTNFFPDWTLASFLMPLPVELKYFTGHCQNGGVRLKWESASETNSNFYTLEKSKDGINFTFVSNFTAAGSSLQSSLYSHFDTTPGAGTIYYRLSETDKNGAKKTFNTITVESCISTSHENGNIYSYNGQVNVDLFLLSGQSVNLVAYDLTGRLIYKNEFAASEGANHFGFTPTLAQGVYLFEVKTNNLSIIKRILIEN